MTKEEYLAHEKKQSKIFPYRDRGGAWHWFGFYSYSLWRLFRILIFRRGLGKVFCFLVDHTRDPNDKYPMDHCLVCGKLLK